MAVLADQFEGKRTYLFEDGEERTLGLAGIQLMRKVEEPDHEERATCAHLISRLSARSGKATVDAGAAGVAKQLQRFLERYEGGFSGAAWRKDERAGLARRARHTVSKDARLRLSSRSLEQMLERAEFAAIWRAALELVTISGLAVELGPLPAVSEQRVLAQALRDLLHDQRSFDYRFDRWVAVYLSVFSESPSWQAATVLPALMSPVEHLLIDQSSFRRQLTVLKRPSALGGRPSGAAYSRCVSAARSLANLLAAHGQVPRDLLDVHDFIRCSPVDAGLP
ncbi:MAG TPA: hypothetical protein VHB79_16895 [Polyangiaceae bacterium]|nr:hypothetical protein [Polyangiaceae bacterium]